MRLVGNMTLDAGVRSVVSDTPLYIGRAKPHNCRFRRSERLVTEPHILQKRKIAASGTSSAVLPSLGRGASTYGIGALNAPKDLVIGVRFPERQRPCCNRSVPYVSLQL